ncbi:MAG TPA: NusA-like transcription termination signal-binding factor [Candidatus Thermoplasmatota archaeon]|nr:NusA-like transcription termination signal-binding factor [Candidatus Thermoplasmatota archaeon]
MVDIKLDADSLRTFAMFERLTGAELKDVIEEEDRIIFVVVEGQVGRALGKGAVNLKHLRENLQKEVVLIGHAAEREAFLKNVFHRFKVEGVEWEDRNGDIIAHVKIPQEEKGKAIGKGGRNIQLARMLMKRHHHIADVSLE